MSGLAINGMRADGSCEEGTFLGCHAHDMSHCHDDIALCERFINSESVKGIMGGVERIELEGYCKCLFGLGESICPDCDEICGGLCSWKDIFSAETRENGSDLMGYIALLMDFLNTELAEDEHLLPIVKQVVEIHLQEMAEESEQSSDE